MVMTIDRLEELCEGEGLEYFVPRCNLGFPAPYPRVVTVNVSGFYRSYRVVIPHEFGGGFLQMRTVGYLHCPTDHSHVNAVLAILGSLNHELRGTRFGWDPDDGEIVGYADVWIEDGDLTQKQFSAVFRSLIACVDRNLKRLSVAIGTGKDLGKTDGTETDKGTLPATLRALLDKIAEADSDDDGDPGKGFEKV